jgi:ABC-type transport system involved in multi-copper enzyme maturation permease subunit
MNPIVHRELVGLLRSPKAVAAQVCLALGCALLVLLRWPTEGVSDLSGARSLQVLRVFGYGLLAGILFLVPAFPATSLVREKVQGTLALLLNSPLSAVSIYAGKLAGVLGFTALLLAMTLPAAAACYVLGGSSVSGGIGLLYAVLAMAALQLATLGLWVSSRSQTIDGALRGTYALVLAVCVVPLAPHWLMEGDSGTLADLSSWFRCLSPIPAVMEVLGQSGVGTHGLSAGTGDSAATCYLILSGAMSLWCAFLTIMRLYHSPLDRARPPGVMTQDRSVGARVFRRLIFLIDPQRRSGNMSRLVNPVMVKEFRSRRFGRSHWMLRLVAISAILSLGLSYLAAAGALGWGVEAMGGALVLLQAALLILCAPSLAAGLISAEREGGGWQLLRMTPISPGRIVRGKLMSVAWPLLLLLCATLPGYIVMMTVKPELSGQVERVVICLVVTAVFAVLVSAAASSLFRSTAAATATSYLVLVGVCVFPLLIWLGREAPFGHRTVETALSIDPVAAALYASDAPGFTTYELLPANWWLIGSASLALLVLLALRTRQLCRPE